MHYSREISVVPDNRFCRPIMLRCGWWIRTLTSLMLLVATASAADVYVATTGNDGNNGTQSNPWRTVARAIVGSASGMTIHVGSGTYIEATALVLPSGVSLIGAGSANTKIQVNLYYNVEANLVTHNGTIGWAPALDKFCIQIPNGSNQTLKGFAMSGQNRACHGAIFMDDGSNVVIDDLHVQDFHMTGIWLNTSRNCEIKNCYLKDNCFGTAYQDAGNIMFHANTNLLIHDNTIVETGVMGGKGGYGIKTYSKQFQHAAFWEYWSDNWGAWAEGTKIYNNSITVPSLGTWMAGSNQVPAITIEFNALSARNVEIYNNYLTNHISLIGFTGTSFHVHHNTFDLGQSYRYAMEADAQNIEFNHNYVYGGYYPIAQWGNNATVSNLRVHHNVFEAMVSGSYVFHLDSSVMDQFVFVANTVIDTQGIDKVFKAAKGNAAFRNVTISDNLFVAASARGDIFSTDNSKITGTITHNGFQNCPTYGGNTISGDMRLQKSGSKPNPFFTLQSNSPAINAGVAVAPYTNGSTGLPDLGAYEYTGVSSNQLPTANAGADANITLPTSSIGLSGSGSDPDGSIASFAWACTSKPVGAANPSFSAATSAATTATGLVAGSYTFRLTVTDNQGATGFDDVVITVALALVVNTAPTISTVANQTINEDAATAALAVMVGDAETAASSLTFTAVAADTTLLPGSGITLGGSGASRTVTLTPAADRNGSTVVTLTVGDGTTTTSSSFTLTVTAVNDAPRLGTSLATVTGEVGIAVDVILPAGAFVDVDGDALTWVMSNLPAGLTFDPVSRRLSGTPTTAGGTTVLVTVRDPAGLPFTQSITVRVLSAGTTAGSGGSGSGAAPTPALTPTDSSDSKRCGLGGAVGILLMVVLVLFACSSRRYR